ncbi:MAG: hypothetical protein M3066_16555 [Actinomycetota bacterium]|nr:hypothetical protein [Actinomycetota bacterium]
MGRSDGLKRVGFELATTALVSLWSRCSPPTAVRTTASMSPSDNLQQAMNLIMPLHVPNIVARGQLTQALFEATDAVFVGLNNIGTVHFARFDFVDGNLCMFSVYDGDFTTYIRDFIAEIGAVFDALMTWVKDPPPLPVASHVDEFIDWIRAHDAFQMPESPVGLISRDLGTLQRDTLVALHRNPNVQLGLYRAYPGFSVAQIRRHLSIGW